MEVQRGVSKRYLITGIPTIRDDSGAWTTCY